MAAGSTTSRNTWSRRRQLPPDLHWFKWEAYLTFISGFALLAIQYYWNASSFLVDPAVMDMTGPEAVLISILSLAARLVRLRRALPVAPSATTRPLLAVAVFALIVGAAFMFTHIFSGRGAFIHVGAMVGTIMAANVFARDHPQPEDRHRGPARRPHARRQVREDRQAALAAQQLPDAARPAVHGVEPLSLPLLAPAVRGWWWRCIVLAGGMVRHFLNRIDAGEPADARWRGRCPPPPWRWSPRSSGRRRAAAPATAAVAEAEALKIVADALRVVPPGQADARGVQGRRAAQGRDARTPWRACAATAQQVIAQAVQGRAMPLGNESGMTDDERARLGAFLAQQ